MDKTAKSRPTNTNLCSRRCENYLFPGELTYSSDHYASRRSQWEATLQCNVVSHRLSPYTAWSLGTGWMNARGNITRHYDPGMPIGHNLAIKDCDHTSDELQHSQLRLLWLSINAGCLGWLNYHSLSLACKLGNIFHKLRDQLTTQK